MASSCRAKASRGQQSSASNNDARPVKRLRTDASSANKQSTLPFASPPISEPPNDSLEPIVVECTEFHESEEDSPDLKQEVVQRRVTVAARERVEFDVDFQVLKSFGTYRLRPKTKRSVGESRIS
jgi:hypothetical protein